MEPLRVNALRSVDLGVADVAANVEFYAKIWELEPVVERNGSVYLRGTGPAHHILGLHPRPHSAILKVTFQAADKETVDALHGRAKGLGVAGVCAPAAVTEPGGGYGFEFADPEGRVIRVLAGDEVHDDATQVADRPYKLSHAVFNSGDAETASAYFVDVLGFKLSDRTRIMDFVRCNRDHHSVAFVRAEGSTLNHIAYEMPDLDSVMRGAGRMRDNGYPIEWGVGRHGPGANVFAYFIGPDNVVIEYTGEVEQVGDDYPTGMPEDWTWPSGRVDRWGVSDGPSKRLHEAELHGVTFAAVP